MEWIEASLYTTNPGVEPVCGMLTEAGVDSVQIDDDIDMKNFLNTTTGQWDYIDEDLMNKQAGEVCVKFYLSNNASGNETLLAVKNGIGFIKGLDIGIDLGRLCLELKNVNDEDWIDNWKKYFKPLEVGKRIVIKPAWEDYQNNSGKFVFNINPGHVFGTGLHQTTQLCIEQLEKYVSPEFSVLDIGCGTGILSLISLMFGAGGATAIDIDPNAADIAYENAALNGIDTHSYKVITGNVLTDISLQAELCKAYDIVVSNIVADVVIQLSKLVPRFLKPGGVFISSGIITMRLEEVKEALLSNGFQITEILEKDDWICVVCRYA